MDIQEFMSLCSTQESINESDRYYEDLERDAMERRIRDIEHERYEQRQENARNEEILMQEYRERENERYQRLRCS
jgi:hypothetical protein